MAEEFNKMKQAKVVRKYVERFEDINSLMNTFNPSLLYLYYVSSFISMLKDDIKPMLNILKPTTLIKVFYQNT